MRSALAARLDAEDAGAVISPCGRYRYLLWRRWDEGSDICAFIGLNPSTADGRHDDPTLRRMRGFAQTWGYGELRVLNAYAWRATDPKALRLNANQAVGPLNNQYIVDGVRDAALVIACWGALCDAGREREVKLTVKHSAARPLHHLGLTSGGFPRHPLRLRADTAPVPWPD